MLLPQPDHLLRSNLVKAQGAAAQKIPVALMVEQFKQLVQMRTELVILRTDGAMPGEAHRVLTIVRPVPIAGMI